MEFSAQNVLHSLICCVLLFGFWIIFGLRSFSKMSSKFQAVSLKSGKAKQDYFRSFCVDTYPW